MKVVQRWECPICKTTYEAPLPATEVYCPTVHPAKGRGRGGHARMTLIEGEPVTNRKKKESPRGKSRPL